MSSNLPASFRRVVVDDADTLFQYGTSWVQETSDARDASVNSGPAFDRTLHRTSANTSFSFDFTGSDIVVSSSVTPVLDSNGTVEPFPQWECVIDGVSLGNMSIKSDITQPQNNLAICQSALGAGPHQLVVKVTTSAVAPFWIDDVQFTPPADADLSNATLKVYNNDPGIAYSGSDFTDGTYGVKVTQATGAKATFSFWGKSVTWVGYIFADFANFSSTATYAIDGGAPVAFNLPTNDVSFGNAIFFRTPDLVPGPHTLVVTHNGNKTSMPLVLDYFFLANDTITASAGTPGTPNTTTADSGSPGDGAGSGTGSNSGDTVSAGSKSSVNAGAIAGGVVGGVVVVLLILLGFYFYRKRKQSRTLASKEAYPDYQQDGAGP